MKACLLSLFLAVFSSSAEFKVNDLFTSNMIIQRDTTVPIYGTAAPGEIITVEFAGQEKTAMANAAGEWQVELDPMPVSAEPRSMIIKSAINNLQSTITNVLVGDVWLCAGQSNMASLMKNYATLRDSIPEMSNTLIRLFKIKHEGVGAPEPTDTVVADTALNKSWQPFLPEYAAEFSATACFFGQALQPQAGVPIGLLYANRGGTQVNMWLPLDVMQNNPVYAQFMDPSYSEWTPREQGNPNAIRAPSYLYNGTIHPLIRYKIRGAIWYQGESDAEYAGAYAQMMDDLIITWRNLWGYDFPFFSVQLAPYGAVAWDNTDESWAWLRAAQMASLKLPPSGVAVITDCGEYKNIHPHDKKPVGERLALLAAALDNPAVNAESPLYKTVRFESGKAFVEFNNAVNGLEIRRVALNKTSGYMPGEAPDAFIAPAAELCGFEICGADRVFEPAQAKLVDKNTVCVWSEKIKTPAAVRYGWKNFPVCNLFNSAGLPASPFRTDAYPMPDFRALLTVPESTFAIKSTTPLFAVDFSRDKINTWSKNRAAISLRTMGKLQGIFLSQQKDIVLYNPDAQVAGRNFLLQADLEVHRANAWGGIAFNYRSPQDYYVLRFRTNSEQVQLIRFVNESPRVLERIRSSEIFLQRMPYTFEVQAVHDEFLGEGLYRVKITNKQTGQILVQQVKKDTGSGTCGGAVGMYTGTPSDTPIYLYSRMTLSAWK